jgi:hypothetical protein
MEWEGLRFCSANGWVACAYIIPSLDIHAPFLFSAAHEWYIDPSTEVMDIQRSQEAWKQGVGDKAAVRTSRPQVRRGCNK